MTSVRFATDDGNVTMHYVTYFTSGMGKVRLYFKIREFSLTRVKKAGYPDLVCKIINANVLLNQHNIIMINEMI